MNILCKDEKTIKVCFIFVFFGKDMFCMQLHGKSACWGRYRLYFEDLKVITQKRTSIFFFLIFAENDTLLSWNIIKLIPLGSSKVWKVNFLHVIIWGWTVFIKCFMPGVVNLISWWVTKGRRDVIFRDCRRSKSALFPQMFLCFETDQGPNIKGWQGVIWESPF